MSLPNAISIFRIILVPFFFTELVSYTPGVERHRWIALAIFAVASATDALDGFLARVTSSKTELGRFLDPLADKLLLTSGYIGLLFVQELATAPPIWVTVTIIFRDIMIIIGLVIVFIITGKIRIQPDLLGKCTTAAQMITLISILLLWPNSYLLWNLTAVLTILSWLSYLNRALKLINQA